MVADARGSATLTLKLQNLLWRTRGLHWDYEFVMRPTEPAWTHWYDLHRDIFDGLTLDERDRAPVSRHGYVLNPPQLYVATAFYDHERHDAAGRPIAHRMVWFPPVKIDAIPPDWGLQVLRELDEPMSRAAGLTATELAEAEAVTRVFERAATAMEEVELAGTLEPLGEHAVRVLLKKKLSADPLA